MLASVSQPALFAIFGGIGMQEFVILAIVAILLFGQKLPDVARSMGGHYSKFRKGLSDIQQSVNQADSYASTSSSRSYSASRQDDYDDYEEATAPKFEPPPSEPKIEAPAKDAPAE